MLAISSDLAEVMGLCDRIAVMRAGTIVAVRERRAITREEVLALALGQGVESRVLGA